MISDWWIYLPARLGFLVVAVALILLVTGKLGYIEEDYEAVQSPCQAVSEK